MSTLPPKLTDLVRDSITEFFHSTGAGDIKQDTKTTLAVAEAQTFSASLGFSGDQMKGAIVIFCGGGLLSATNPQREFVPALSEADNGDWIGEIANQVIGNLKRLVAGYRVDFLLSTPTVLFGRQLTNTKGAKDSVHTLWFTVKGFPVQVDFTAELAPTVSFEGEPEVVEQAAGGDAMLF